MHSVNVVSSERWTPEQQVYELTRRFEIVDSLMEIDKSNFCFCPNPADIIIASPPKNGTTWMIHICHQIRMHGAEPDFEDQLEVFGWIEASEKVLGVDPAARPQPAKPRIFNTHLLYPSVPLGGRRIYCFRDQKDATISAYHFSNTLISLKGRVSLEVFAKFWINSVTRNLKDLLIWWEHRHDEDLLLLFFDDLKEDHAGCVRRIAKYMGVDCDEDTIARVVHTTSHAEMSKIGSKFRAQRTANTIAEKLGEPMPTVSVDRVRKGGGRSGDGHQLPPEVIEHIDQLWREIVTSKLGFENLKEMRKEWKRERI